MPGVGAGFGSDDGTTGGRRVGGAGSGWRGPVRIWPGLGGGGAGRVGIGMPFGATGGTSGDPTDNGGRSGMEERAGGAASSAASFFSGAFS
jgi:hypothetical protein